MIPIETQIFRLIFPPAGAIPLEKLEAVPTIRQHIDSIIDLASTEHGISSPDESAALTARVIELRDTPGPDGKVRTWRTIAEICGTTLDAVRHRYGKATIRKSRIVEEVAVPDGDEVATTPESQTGQGLPPAGAPWYNDIAKEWSLGPTGYPIKNEKVPASPEEFQSFEGVAAPEVSESAAPKPITEKPTPLDPETLAEVDRMLGGGMSVLHIVAELEMKGKLVPWTKIRARAAYLAKMKRKEVAPEPEKADLTPCQRGQLIGPKIPHEMDDEIIMHREAGNSLKEIVNHLDCLGIKCTETDVSARVLSEQRKRSAAKKAEEATVQAEGAPVPQDDAAQPEEPQEAEALPAPVAISRKELDLLMWDLHKAGKTLDEISDILYSKGLYYSPKSVRVRLLSQGAKL